MRLSLKKKVRIKKRVAAPKNCLLMKLNCPPLRPNSLPLMSPLGDPPERGDQWTTMVLNKLTSRFTMNPPVLKKQPTARRKPNGMKPWARK